MVEGEHLGQIIRRGGLDDGECVSPGCRDACQVTAGIGRGPLMAQIRQVAGAQAIDEVSLDREGWVRGHLVWTERVLIRTYPRKGIVDF